jgi:hypothetical protein
MAGRSTHRGDTRGGEALGGGARSDARGAVQASTLGQDAQSAPAQQDLATPQEAPASAHTATEDGAADAASKVVLPAEDAAPDAAEDDSRANAGGASLRASPAPAGEDDGQASAGSAAAPHVTSGDTQDGLADSTSQIIVATAGSRASPAEVAARPSQVPPDDTNGKATGSAPPGVLCRVSSVGSVSGHGVREDGRVAEFWPSGSVGYFSEAAVKKLPHMLIPLS